MSKIKWKNKIDIENEKLIQEQSKTNKEKHKGKDKDKLTRKELDELIIIMAEEKGLL